MFDLLRLTLHGILLKKQSKMGEVKTTLGEYLKENNYSQRFIHHFFVPFLVAIGTCTHEDMMNYPANIILHLVCSTDHIFEQVKGLLYFI
jgi:predicted NAD/FAD-binding protein